MPDADGKVPLDSQGREILDEDGREACGCCEDCTCPPDPPSAVTLSFHVQVVDAATMAVVCEEDNSVELTLIGGCNYSGTANFCGGLGVDAALLGLSGGDPCQWEISWEPGFGGSIADGPATRLGRDNMFGAYTGTFPVLSSDGYYYYFSAMVVS